MLSFPRSRGRLFADSPTALAAGVKYLSFGSSSALPGRAAAALVRLPMARRYVSSEVSYEPRCGWLVLDRALDALGGGSAAQWVYLASPWDKPRVRVLGLDTRGRACRSVVIDRPDPGGGLSDDVWETFRVPQTLSSLFQDGWQVNETEVLPPHHRAQPWQSSLLRAISEEISRRLSARLPRPPGIPVTFAPAHGDFVPWNVRHGADGRVWVIDWEDVCWAPPSADLVRFAAAARSLSRRPAAGPSWTRRLLVCVPAHQVRIAAAFWLCHRNLSADLVVEHRERPVRQRHMTRTAREVEFLEELSQM